MLGSPLVLGAAPAGLAVGALAWLVLAHGAGAQASIDDLQSRADALAPPARHALRLDVGAAALSAPIFALTTGPGAVADIQVELIGIARTPSRTSALLAINGKPAEWLGLGETRDDVTLDEAQADKVTVDTPIGSKDIVLGVKPANVGAGATPASSVTPPPSGYRMPPPPASAPRP